MKKIVFEFNGQSLVGYLAKEGLRQNAILLNNAIEYRRNYIYVPKEHCHEYLKQAA